MLSEGEALTKWGEKKLIWNCHLFAFISGSNAFYQAQEIISNDRRARLDFSISESDSNVTTLIFFLPDPVRHKASAVPLQFPQPCPPHRAQSWYKSHQKPTRFPFCLGNRRHTTINANFRGNEEIMPAWPSTRYYLQFTVNSIVQRIECFRKIKQMWVTDVLENIFS